MVLDMISIIAHNPCENKPIRMTKTHQPSKGEKGELVKRLLRGKWQIKYVQQWSYHQEAFQLRSIPIKKIQPPIDSWDQVKDRKSQSSTIILNTSMKDEITSASQASKEKLGAISHM